MSVTLLEHDHHLIYPCAPFPLIYIWKNFLSWSNLLFYHVNFNCFVLTHFIKMQFFFIHLHVIVIKISVLKSVEMIIAWRRKILSIYDFRKFRRICVHHMPKGGVRELISLNKFPSMRNVYFQTIELLITHVPVPLYLLLLTLPK